MTLAQFVCVLTIHTHAASVGLAAVSAVCNAVQQELVRAAVKQFLPNSALQLLHVQLRLLRGVAFLAAVLRVRVALIKPFKSAAPNSCVLPKFFTVSSAASRQCSFTTGFALCVNLCSQIRLLLE